MKTIVVLTVAFWMLQLVTASARGGFMVEWLGLRSWFPPSVPGDAVGGFNFLFPVQLFTYGLLHSTADIWHIAFNMFFLWIFGVALEASMGKATFLRLYVGAAVVGGLAQWAYGLVTKSPVPTVGASGAVYGVMVLYACRNPHQTMMLIFPPIPLPVWFWVGFRVFMDLMNFLGSAGHQTTTALAAHLGGALFGYIWFRRGDVIQRTANRHRQRKAEHRNEEQSEDRREMDRILAKIQTSGLSSLDRSERSFLERRSRELRKEN